MWCLFCRSFNDGNCPVIEGFMESLDELMDYLPTGDYPVAFYGCNQLRLPSKASDKD